MKKMYEQPDVLIVDLDVNDDIAEKVPFDPSNNDEPGANEAQFDVDESETIVSEKSLWSE